MFTWKECCFGVCKRKEFEMVTIGRSVKRFNVLVFCSLLFFCFSVMSYAGQKDIPVKAEKKLAIAKVNINTASVDQLTTLPGVGVSLAERIVRHRTEVGKFKTPEELISVKGIGKKKLGKMINLIVVK